MAKTVLIVDDDPTQRRIMQAVCEKAGYPVLQAEDCLLYTSPSPRDQRGARMPSSA